MFSLQLLLFAALAFGILYRSGIYPPELRAVNIDSDVLYRKSLPKLIRWSARTGGYVWEGSKKVALGQVRNAVTWVENWHRPPGALGEPWPAGATAGWAAFLLAIFLCLAWF